MRIRADGFEIEGDLLGELRGRIVKTTAVRKRFEDGVLACRSGDGKRSDDGVSCADCQHPDCRALLRIQLRDSTDTFVLDLPHSSARNLILLEDQLARTNRDLITTEIALRVRDRGYWGEVHFHAD